jgi:hypothetical protein
MKRIIRNLPLFSLAILIIGSYARWDGVFILPLAMLPALIVAGALVELTENPRQR